MLDVVFHKWTWLQGTIESNTKAELLDVIDMWIQSAEKLVLEQESHRNQNRSNEFSPEASGIGLEESALLPGAPALTATGLGSRAEDPLQCHVTHHSGSSAAASWPDRDEYSAWDPDEEVFYDCEEGEIRPFLSSQAPFGRPLSAMPDLDQRHQPMWCFRSPRVESLLDASHSSGDGDGSAPSQSLRESAVVIVETVLVMAQFSFWTLHRLYSSDLKTLFSVEPQQVLQRVCSALLPGLHGPLLEQPDLYGPLLAAFLLPQVLLISMDGGCSQSGLLGNAVVVSLCLWTGLSALYRILAFFVAPAIDMRHCLCVVGYSLFAWCLCLFAAAFLEQDASPRPWVGHGALPVVLFGLPAALAQGCMFWEHTPAATAAPPQTGLLPSRPLQRLMWAVPKLIAFVLAAGTHYQVLWYLFRVFLPGRKNLCRLSAIMDPAHYADILTQKELIRYAGLLLTRRGDH